MRRNRGGFTILEVMIFLAISGAMVAAALVAINGQQTKTEFTQGMRDIDSKLQDTLNDVSNGNFSYDNQNCTLDVVTGRPVLSGTGDGIGSRSQCLFLGEALQFSSSGKTGGVDNNSRFAIYTVLGRRLKDSVSVSGSKTSVSSFTDAKPTTQLGLTQYYSYQNGITSTSISYAPGSASQTTSQYSLLGLYTSFQSAADHINDSNADAAQTLQPYVYSLPDDGTAYGAGAKACIDGNNPGPGGTCEYSQTLSSSSGSKGLSICFNANNSRQTARITIYNTSEGVGTRLEYNPDGCPAS